MKARLPLFFALLLTLAVLSAATSSALADGKGSRSGSTVGFTAITGSPLTINVARDGSYQVNHDGVDPSTPGQVYYTEDPEADAGIFVWYGSYVIGPDFDNHETSASNSYDAWSNVSQSAVSGAGTSGDPYVVTTNLSNTASGVTASVDTSYVDGADFFRIDWEICTPEPGPISTFLAADFYLQGSDSGFGYYDAATGSVGGYNANQDWFQIYTPVTPPSAYMEAYYGTIWDAIGEAGVRGTGFNNTIDTDDIDNGGGLQWNRTVSGCASFASFWSFGTTPVLPPTSVQLTDFGGQTGSLLVPLLVVVALMGAGGGWLWRRRLLSRA